MSERSPQAEPAPASGDQGPTPWPAGAWLPRALVLSALLHALLWGVAALAAGGGSDRRSRDDLVDIELAPPPPKAEALPKEKAMAPEAVAAAPAPAPEPEAGGSLRDAGPDAGPDARPDAAPDARPRRRRKPDAGPDAAPDAAVDAGADAGEQDATAYALLDAGQATDAATDAATDGALASVTDAPPGDGGVAALAPEDGLGDTPTSAGTAANLLAYFPKGHLVTALVRFDRLRNTRWAEPSEAIFAPMPDYRALFGGGKPRLVERFDTLVISSPKPRDPTATILAGRSVMSRRELRELFERQGTPITWSTVSGGALGERTGPRVLPGDPRVVLAPAAGWFFLAAPADLPGLTAPRAGELDTATATVPLPPWLAAVQTIDREAGEARGPAVILTVTATRARWKVPEVGLGVTSVPAPERATLAMELVKQGFVVRGNVKLASDTEAEELVMAVETARKAIGDSTFLQSVLRRANAYNAVMGLSVKRTGSRVAYATSISIKDAEILMALAGAAVQEYFGKPP